jgi:hypothetical protein
VKKEEGLANIRLSETIVAGFVSVCE